MTIPAILSCGWVLAAAGTALLPMRRQLAPGLALLLSAPVLVAWLALEAGWLAGGVSALIVLSVFRYPLGALLRRVMARGKTT